MSNWLNADDNTPPIRGWWPVTYCRNTEEGFLPAAAYWSGRKWLSPLPITHYWPKLCRDAKEARAIASDHDFEEQKAGD